MLAAKLLLRWVVKLVLIAATAFVMLVYAWVLNDLLGSLAGLTFLATAAVMVSPFLGWKRLD